MQSFDNLHFYTIELGRAHLVGDELYSRDSPYKTPYHRHSAPVKGQNMQPISVMSL